MKNNLMTSHSAKLIGSATLATAFLAVLSMPVSAYAQQQDWGATRDRGMGVEYQNDPTNYSENYGNGNTPSSDMSNNNNYNNAMTVQNHDHDGKTWGDNNNDNSMSADVKKTWNQDEYVYTVTLAGVRKEDIKLTETNGSLMVYANTVASNAANSQDNQTNMQNGQTSFNKTINLPRDARYDKVNAKFRDGVLVIHVERRHDRGPRDISIG